MGSSPIAGKKKMRDPFGSLFFRPPMGLELIERREYLQRKSTGMSICSIAFNSLYSLFYYNVTIYSIVHSPGSLHFCRFPQVL
ncbi:hypothetical protein, partial [Oceanispirochaeta sp.]|uniref:hypothetical protein n=1 Tax=Oceanispirochaeta sp. TaxID=2035350 RepID=UPI002612950A